MRKHFCIIFAGILFFVIFLASFLQAEVISMTPDREAVSDLPSNDDGWSISDKATYGSNDIPIKSSDRQSKEISLTYAGSELWQGTFAAAGIGHYAYAYPYFGFQVIDMTDPASPVVVGKIYYPANPEDMVVDGNFVYVASGSPELLIFDVSDPYLPILAGTVESSDRTRGIEIIGTTAYISADNEFLVVDISDPYSPVTIQTFAPGCCDAQHAVIMGDYAYIAADYALHIWDLSDINSPVHVDSRFYGGDAWDIVSSGNIAYMLDRRTGLYLLNAANPSWPTSLGSWVDTSSYLKDVEIVGDYSYVSSSSSIRIIDVSNPWDPQFSSSWPALGWNTGTYIDDNRLFISDWAGGVSRYDISSPDTPILESVYESPGMGYDLAISGNYAFEANGLKGLKVLDISNPESPTVISSFDTPGEVRAAEVIGQYVYLSDDITGVMIFDVSDPYNPSLVHTYNPPATTYDIMAVGDYAYLASRDSGLLVLDISNPQAPTQIGNLQVPGMGFKLAIQGNYVYLSAHDEGLYIIDISTPSEPSLAGKYDAYACYAVCVSGDYAYFSHGYDRELSVIDISDPTNPVFVDAFYFAFHWARHMERVGDYLYVAAYLEGFKILNISDPVSPYLAGEYSTSPGWTWDVDIVDDNIYVTADNGFLILWQNGCGGPNGAGGYDVADAVFLISYIFRDGPPPQPLRAGDVNCDDAVDVADVVHLINFVFRDGSPPCGGCY